MFFAGNSAIEEGNLMKKVLSSITLFLLCAAVPVMGAITLPFSDDFESYVVGQEPPYPWFTLAAGKGIVTDIEAHSGGKAVQISGGPFWSQTCLLELDENYPNKIGYEAWVKINSQGSSMFIGFFDQIQNMAPQFNAVYFSWYDGKVYFMSSDKNYLILVPIMESFSLGVWHKVRVQIDFESLKANVWVDDVLVGDQIQASPRDATYELYGQTYYFQLKKVGVEHYNAAPTYFDDFSVFEWNVVETVSLDIKPGSFPNSINPNSRGKLPVAILATDSFDPTTVSPATVSFGATGTEAAPLHFALEDVNGDGRVDMIFHFNTRETGIMCGDTSACLTGETFGGQAIKGSDSIKTVGCK
jgi:YHS domain-containing protein